MPADSFASSLLAEMRERDPRAQSLLSPRLRTPDQSVVGIKDQGQFVPVLYLGAPSKKYNVMTLYKPVQERWLRALRGTPEELAQRLCGPYQHLWLPALAMPQPTENKEK